MSYFTLFELPISLELDLAGLTKKYYSLSKLYHPDKFVQASEEEKSLALAKSLEVNQAYKALQKLDGRIKHVLEIFDFSPKEGEDKLPMDFLMEMMDLNEKIMTFHEDHEPRLKEEIIAEISKFKASLQTQIVQQPKIFDLNNPDVDHLKQLKDYYLRSRYLTRLEDNLDKKQVEL